MLDCWLLRFATDLSHFFPDHECEMTTVNRPGDVHEFTAVLAGWFCPSLDTVLASLDSDGFWKGLSGRRNGPDNRLQGGRARISKMP